MPARIGLVGLGWRAEFFLGIARSLPDRFVIDSVATRSESSAERARTEYGVRATTSLADFARDTAPDFTIVATPREITPGVIRELLAAGHTVLAETPPAPDVRGLVELYTAVGGAPLQVAEQYQYQPHHRARLEAVRSGLLGDLTTATVSVAHGYHGVSYLRLLLGVGMSPVTIDAWDLPDPVAATRGRDGWATDPTPVANTRTLARLDFGSASGLYDFGGEQYFSPLRSRRVHVTGTQGELVDDELTYVSGIRQVTRLSLRRESTGEDGDLGGFHLERIAAADRELYRNEFAPARLSDDELAGAEILRRMADFASTGHAFYGLADAAQDHYLALLIDEAARTGGTRTSEDMPWHQHPSTTPTRETGSS